MFRLGQRVRVHFKVFSIGSTFEEAHHGKICTLRERIMVGGQPAWHTSTSSFWEKDLQPLDDSPFMRRVYEYIDRELNHG